MRLDYSTWDAKKRIVDYLKAMEKVDILTIAAHPDDVELSCSGTLIKSIEAGKTVGICDLTQGELGTRGSAEIRLQEARIAQGIIGAAFRINLGMEDGFFQVNRENQIKIIEVIRACQPDIVLLNALVDRHPDHGKGAELQKTACFLSGLRKLETEYNGEQQECWRPNLVLHTIQDRFMKPTIVVDVTSSWDKKMEAIKAFSSQFSDPKSSKPESMISGEGFLKNILGRGRDMGRLIHAEYGEGFVSERPVGIADLTLLQ